MENLASGPGSDSMVNSEKKGNEVWTCPSGSFCDYLKKEGVELLKSLSFSFVLLKALGSSVKYFIIFSDFKLVFSILYGVITHL